jgi:hypothetical protein
MYYGDGENWNAGLDENTGQPGSFGFRVSDNREDNELYQDDQGPDFEVSLPHQCDQWTIAAGDRAYVLRSLRQFRDELDKVIAEVDAQP